MGKLATKPYLAASLNIMVASRQGGKSKPDFTDEEIAEILMAMAENDSAAGRNEHGRNQYWQQQTREIS